MELKFGLDSQTVLKIQKVFNRHVFVEKAIIYGSRAKGDYKPYSDIDVALIGENLTLSEMQTIENELDDLLLPYTFDVSILKQIENNNLIEHIQRVGQCLFER